MIKTVLKRRKECSTYLATRCRTLSFFLTQFLSNNTGNKFGLKINLAKTVKQKISRNPDVSCINLKGRQLKEVDTFSYLGSVVTRNRKIQNEVNERIKKYHNFTIL